MGEKALFGWFMVVLSLIVLPGGLPEATAKEIDSGAGTGRPLVVAVEFNTHASPAYVARARGMYEKEGLRIRTFDSYVTGMALAAALTRGDVDAAYICLVPAIGARANGGVALKVVSGTHHYGYAVVADPKKVKVPRDLEREEVRVGCVREGNASDVMFERGIRHYGLNRERLVKKIRRMNPPEQILALRMGKLDAAIVPEHYPSIAEAEGFKVIFRAQDVWPRMQGSVLAVSERLLKSSPEVVRRLVMINRQAVRWINGHPEEAARIVTGALRVTDDLDAKPGLYPEKQARPDGNFSVTHATVLSSMTRGVKITADVDPAMVQETIDTMVGLGLIRGRFEAREILKLDWPE